jgi:hypothetical protein
VATPAADGPRRSCGERRGERPDASQPAANAPTASAVAPGQPTCQPAVCAGACRSATR